jgi:imidazolonepropionase-like amidohydrolase
VLTAVADAVHAAGGRVAVHTQHAAGGAAAVAAGVNSVEHGMCLDPGLLARMAERGMALTPTLSTIETTLREVRDRPDGSRKRWYVGGASVHGRLVAAAAEAGVQVLAGTDSVPHGRVRDEVRALAAAGMRPHDALVAASWGARAYLGLPGLEPGVRGGSAAGPGPAGRPGRGDPAGPAGAGQTPPFVGFWPAGRA